MKVRYDTGWDSLINESFNEKPVNKLEETSPELSKYSSISTLTNIWTAKRSWGRKNRQKLPKWHRFPPSLLTSKAADLWNTLSPLRANCSCSSVSIGDDCSRLSSSGVSIPDASVGSNSNSSVVSLIKNTAVRETLGDTLDQTYLAFELLITRMVRLLNILNEKSISLASHVCSDPDLKILLPIKPTAKKNRKMIAEDSHNRFPSTTPLSSDSSNHYRNRWLAGRIEKKWESSSKFELAEHKRRGKSCFSPTSLEPKTLRVPKSVLTKEELVYLLRYKKSLLSEYFQRRVDSTDLTKNLNPSEQKSLIYGTQSDSRLQEHNLYKFVQFIRERKKNDAEDVLKKIVYPPETQKSNTNSTSLNTEDSKNLSSPKRRVTFSDPLAEDPTTLLNRSSSHNEDGISSVQSFATAITNNVEMPWVQKTQSDTTLDSKSTSPSDSSVSLKACFANLSLKSLSTKTQDPNLDSNKSTIEQTVRNEDITDEILGSTQSEDSDEIESQENSPCYDTSVVEMGEEKSEEEEDIVSEPSLQKLSQSGITECAEQQFSDSDVYDRPSLPSGKTVTFQDCCETISDQSITADRKKLGPLPRSDDELVSSSDSKGRFELCWKGCWDRQSRTEFVQDMKQLEESCTGDEEQLVESNSTGIPSESFVFIPIESHRPESNAFSNKLELSAAVSGSKTSYYTTMEDEMRSASNCGSRHRSRDLGDTSSSSYLNQINETRTVAARLKKDEMIPWMINSKESFLTPCGPVTESNCGFQSDPETIKSRHRADLRRRLGNAYKGIINPEIWRSEVKAEGLCKSDWYTGRGSDKYSWKTPSIRSDWLIRKLEELQSSPETDYDSDYYAGSEMESDIEWERDMSLVKRSFSDIDKDYENCRRFKMKRRRFWPGKKIIFNECRCHKNTPSNRYDPRPKRRDLRHTSFRESDQRSNQNFFSHLRARLILDSETDDSDFAPSIQSEFRYDLKPKDEHVNKMKCRRFVRSLKSIGSEEDRQFSSARLLRMTFEKPSGPAGVRSALSTRTVGTSISENQNFCNMMDVCIDTYDLCPRKKIGTLNKPSDFILSNNNRSCQTVETFPSNLNSLQCTEGDTQVSPILAERDMPSRSSLGISRSNDQKISSAFDNLSTHINNASNNLAKSRCSEIKTEPEILISIPVTEGDNFGNTPIQSIPPILPNSAKISNNVLDNSDHSTAEESSCPICNAHKKPVGRYVRPACVVKGDRPDSKTNEKDPWNRVMERAKAQYRCEGRNTAMCSEMKPSLKRSRVMSSTYESIHLKSFERNLGSFEMDQTPREEIRIQLVQVKNNSSETAAYDSEQPTLTDKISSPPLKDRPALRLPPVSALYSSTSSDPPMFNLPNRTRTPRKTKKPLAIANMSNRLLYIISETAELSHQPPMKSAAANFFT